MLLLWKKNFQNKFTFTEVIFNKLVLKYCILINGIINTFFWEYGPVVQLDRISDFGSEGWGFESSLGHIIFFFCLIFHNLGAQDIISKIELPSYINETSGLEFYNDFLITHNDSGNAPVIYYLDKKGDISFKRSFDSLINNDWEDLTTDKDFLYIADIGNNFDTRKNLQIVKVPIDPTINKIEFINFYYPEQSEFKFRPLSMYDAEALISIDDYLLIFTKNRAKEITDIYKIPKTPGNHIAKKIGSLNCQSIVTGADYDKELNLLVLTSTFKFEVYYILKIEDFDLKNIVNNKIDTYEIPLEKTQIEAIKIINNNTFWVTSEAETFGNPMMYKLKINSVH